jgi:hypothetical protein
VGLAGDVACHLLLAESGPGRVGVAVDDADEVGAVGAGSSTLILNSIVSRGATLSRSE